MENLNSSKVKVEYFDPPGVYPLLSKELASRLPLRNLHWKSPTRPLRSIDSLHVDLVANGQPSQQPTSPVPGGQGPENIDEALQRTLSPAPVGSERPPSAASSEGVSNVVKGRRHQIPGLRRTPYLKVYFLRCDDNDTYKASARKQLREWIKEHTPPSQNSSSSSANNAENHDAFEWLIVHVVMPDTTAAGQPRWSSSGGTSGAPVERTASGPKWPGRSSSTILEKLRADFNVSSKSAPDRIAQIRLQKNVVPPHMLPTGTSPAAAPFGESPGEQENAWNDLIAKFKTLILMSFDLRVRQYEEDIREKDAQRSLPGWNFCTFFVLKEGLARGFESVGLVEDALLGYDELSVGLDSVLRDLSSDSSSTQATTFSDSTEDLKLRAISLLSQSSDDSDISSSRSALMFARPLNVTSKNYRDLIVSSTISIYDFKCYIFARQLTLLLRLGNAGSVRSALGTPEHAPSKSQSTTDVASGLGTSEHIEDLVPLGEICRRTLSFITAASRVMRDDLSHGLKDLNTDSKPVIDHVVSSWVFSVVQQILDETAASALPVSIMERGPESASSNKVLAHGGYNQELKVSVTEQKTMMHPARSSSLHSRMSSSTTELPYSRPPASAQVVYENAAFSPVPASAPVANNVLKAGVEELAAYRADLYLIKRRIVENQAKAKGWVIGWAALEKSEFGRQHTVTDINLDEDGDSNAHEERPSMSEPTDQASLQYLDDALNTALESLEAYRKAYERLSDLAVKHYLAANRTKASESIMGELAALKFEIGDYATAAAYFHRVAPYYAEDRWNFIESTMLRMYARCLKELHRKDEYVRTVLNLLAKSAAKEKERSVPNIKPGCSSLSTEWLDDDEIDASGYLDELVQFSQQLPYTFTTSMSKYFSHVKVEPYIRHLQRTDGFQMLLTFRYLLEDKLLAQKMSVRLVSAVDGQSKEIVLQNDSPIEIKRGSNKFWLDAKVNTYGTYFVDKITIEAGKLAFVHETLSKEEAKTPLGLTTSSAAASIQKAKRSRVLVYPRQKALLARIECSKEIHIQKKRAIEVQIETGGNELKEGIELRFRAASAGLRLHTGDATIIQGDGISPIQDQLKAGTIRLSPLAAGRAVRLSIPYELEVSLVDISIRLEVEYTSEQGSSTLLSSHTVPHELSVDVNVHDHFKARTLFSRFVVRTATDVPMRLMDVSLSETPGYAVKSGMKGDKHMLVYSKQPANVTYKITKRDIGNDNERAAQPLLLSIQYRSLEDDILQQLQQVFVRDIQASPFDQYIYTLVPALRDQVKQKLSGAEYERITLLGEVRLPPYPSFSWTDTVNCLPPAIQPDLHQWLENWHQSNAILPLQDPSSPNYITTHPPQTLLINVAIPTVQILHTVSLTLPQPDKSSTSPATTKEQPHPHPIVPLSQPLLATLTIKHTRHWSSSPTSNASAQPTFFTYELHAPSDTWLIGGQRRATFTASEGEEKAFPVVLIPVKVGWCLLPGVEVRIVERGHEGGGGDGKEVEEKGGEGTEREKEGVVKCEVEYKSLGEMVCVVPERQRVDFP